MPVTMTATFETRREAEMTVERLVQQFELDRSSIFITTDGDDNSVGDEEAGSDTEAGVPSAETRNDAPLNGAILVTLEVADEGASDRVREAFAEFDASGVTEAAGTRS